mmetsp:Transcript_38112/g.92611  ORF Transcript_38112/g.92611 Transcript_38112/m.92611 type:complete len:217 (-) Transcript_38112:423-1073(-)
MGRHPFLVLVCKRVAQAGSRLPRIVSHHTHSSHRLCLSSIPQVLGPLFALLIISPLLFTRVASPPVDSHLSPDAALSSCVAPICHPAHVVRIASAHGALPPPARRLPCHLAFRLFERRHKRGWRRREPIDDRGELLEVLPRPPTAGRRVGPASRLPWLRRSVVGLPHDRPRRHLVEVGDLVVEVRRELVQIRFPPRLRTVPSARRKRRRSRGAGGG